MPEQAQTGNDPSRTRASGPSGTSAAKAAPGENRHGRTEGGTPGSFGNQVSCWTARRFHPSRPAGRRGEQAADGPCRANHSNDVMPTHPGGGEA
jgi:hypothetical protein